MRFFAQGESLHVLAPAKINLSLDILGRRPDGFHDLQTVMLSVRLVDELRFSRSLSGKVTLDVHPVGGPIPDFPTDAKNLIVRAAMLLKQETGCEEGVVISLWKRIPAEAGLGGGSSDAAATLVGLNRFWKLGLSSSALHALAASLGSDLNFFIDSPVGANCSGRGERVREIRVKCGTPVVIVKPPSGLSTAKVFQEWSRQQATNAGRNNLHRSEIRCGDDVYQMGNDLEFPARQLNPDIEKVLSALRSEQVIASAMSGSGSACYAVCRTHRQAQRIARRLQQQGLGRVFVVNSGV